MATALVRVLGDRLQPRAVELLVGKADQVGVPRAVVHVEVRLVDVQPERGGEDVLDLALVRLEQFLIRIDVLLVTLPFNLFSTGFALAVYACFFLFSDLGGRQIALLRTLGQNALAAYILHELVARAVQAFAPADSPLWWVAATFTLYVGITYLFVRHLEKNGVYLRM